MGVNRLTEPSPGPGNGHRRRKLQKRRVILDAAAEIFMRDGYGGASVDDIVAAAGVSKRTLYAHFDGKHALFVAIVRESCEALLLPLRETDITERTPEATLMALARTFLDVILAPSGISLYRIVVAEAPRFPELGRAFYEAGHAPAAELLAAYLERHIVDGTFCRTDARICAEAFFQFVAGYAHDRLLLGVDATVTQRDVDAYLQVTVDVFLAGIRAR